MFGIEYQTAAQAVRVCKAIESCTRVQHLSWKHHQEIAGRDDKVELLEWVESLNGFVVGPGKFPPAGSFAINGN
jgi:hypothetical protein